LTDLMQDVTNVRGLFAPAYYCEDLRPK
jgi:hypothetical protein